MIARREIIDCNYAELIYNDNEKTNPMAKAYLPRLKVGTAKDIVKSIISTPAGKKISDSKFKSFLKNDKGLRKYSYLKKESHLTKLQTKKFFSQAVKSVSDSKQLKIGRLTQKRIGIKLDKNGQLSTLGLKKIYERAAAQEIESSKPTGPSPEEVERQKRRETAIQTLHKRDRADEVAADAKNTQPNAGNTQNKVPAPINRQPITSGRTATGSQAQKQGATINDNVASQKNSAVSRPQKKIPLLLLPIYNLSLNKAEAEQLTRKTDQVLQSAIRGFGIFNIISNTEIDQALDSLGLKELPGYRDDDLINSLADRTSAQLYIFGYCNKNGDQVEIKIYLVNSQNGKKIELSSIRGEMRDLFEIERRINWQINNSLKSEKEEASGGNDTPKRAVDLPI
jgi:TolB-like protein